MLLESKKPAKIRENVETHTVCPLLWKNERLSHARQSLAILHIPHKTHSHRVDFVF